MKTLRYLCCRLRYRAEHENLAGSCCVFRRDRAVYGIRSGNFGGGKTDIRRHIICNRLNSTNAYRKAGRFNEVL